jgi:hypothetical protein
MSKNGSLKMKICVNKPIAPWLSGVPASYAARGQDTGGGNIMASQ